VAHLDLKEVGYEQEVIDRAVALLGTDGLVVTTLEDRSVAAVTQAFPGVRTALSLGRDRRELALARLPGTRLSELFPARRIRACGAHGVAVHQATRHGLFTMVWTVNDDTLMRAFLAHPRVDVLVTDRPRRAVALRGPLTPSRH
jgi:glycerophosphoryl diester phosphodiesterase